MSDGFFAACVIATCLAFSSLAAIKVYARWEYSATCKAKGGVYLPEEFTCVRRDAVIPL